MSKIEAYSNEKLNTFKSIITNDLVENEKDLERLKATRKAEIKKKSTTNTDFNQSSKHFQLQAKNKQHIKRLQNKSRELKAALKRIDDKTYGVCERSGKLIREERLIARPIARFDIIKK